MPPMACAVIPGGGRWEMCPCAGDAAPGQRRVSLSAGHAPCHSRGQSGATGTARDLAAAGLIVLVARGLIAS